MASKFPKLRWVCDESDDEYYSADENLSDIEFSLLGLNLGPRKKHLVLCLNGLLAHNIHKNELVKVRANRPADGFTGNKLVFKRHFCDEFLKFCFERFEVGIWSSAIQSNVDGVIPFVFRALKPKLLFIWNQSHCTHTSLRTMEKKAKPVFLKELKKIWKNELLSYGKGQFTPSNTLFIDGSPYRALLNPPNTAIFPVKYTVDLVDDKFLGPNGELRSYLEGIAAADDVPTYVKAHHIGQDAITPNHHDWDYYSKIMRDFPRDNF